MKKNSEEMNDNIFSVSVFGFFELLSGFGPILSEEVSSTWFKSVQSPSAVTFMHSLDMLSVKMWFTVKICAWGFSGHLFS